MIHIASAEFFTAAEKAKLDAAIPIANSVLETDRFADEVGKHRRLDGSAGFDDTEDASGLVLKKIRENTVGLTLSIVTYPAIEFWKRHEVAHEDDQSGGVVFNRKFFDAEAMPSLVNTLVHEFAHVCGYTHSHAASLKWATTVPYAVGNIAQVVAADILGLKE